MKKGIVLLFVITGVIPFIITPLGAKDQPSSPPETSSACDSFGVVKSLVEKKAPFFSLKTLDGNQVSLCDFRGKPVLLKFWATWCPSCVEELPMMERFSIGRKDQLVILLAAIDGEKEKKVQRVIKKNNFTLPVLLDAKGKTARAYGVNFVPISFLINQEGLIMGTILGERNWASQEAWSAIKELLNLR